jgi:hypothetical protein
MDYLLEARKFLSRALDARGIERDSHLKMADEMLGKAIDQRDAAARSVSWQEEDVLGFFQSRGARPGQDVLPQSLLGAWGTRGPVADMWAALDKLEEKGLVVKNTAGTAYALTDAGYAKIRN